MLQSIHQPVGVSVFGSCLLHVPPDRAAVCATVMRKHRRPADAFKEARVAAQAVRQFLDAARVSEVQTSRVTLAQGWRGGSRDDYEARVSFRVRVDDLDRFEEIVAGIVEAGATEIDSVTFQTGDLSERRAEARRGAMSAAREKAELYAEAAGVVVGPILHIEDVDPEELRGAEGHVLRDPGAPDAGDGAAFAPGSISIGAAVRVVFGIGT
jgi:uncharacterized protein YggE